MKKILGFLACLLIVGSALGAPQYIEAVASTVVMDQIAVSSTTATALTSQVTGRTKVCFQSVDATYGVWIATHSGVSATNAWYIGDKDNPNSSLCLPIGDNYTLYGLAETGQLTTQLGVIELRQHR